MSENGGGGSTVCEIPGLSLEGVFFYEGSACLASASASVLMLNKSHVSGKALWIVIITGTDTAIYFNSFE